MITLDPLLIAIIVIVVLVVLFSVTCIKIVPQAEAAIVERLGSYLDTWNNGLHVKVPFIDRVRPYISLKEQVFDFPPQPVITKDNVTMSIDSVVSVSYTHLALRGPRRQDRRAGEPSRLDRRDSRRGIHGGSRTVRLRVERRSGYSHPPSRSVFPSKSFRVNVPCSYTA